MGLLYCGFINFSEKGRIIIPKESSQLPIEIEHAFPNWPLVDFRKKSPDYLTAVVKSNPDFHIFVPVLPTVASVSYRAFGAT
jgi:hypothetical protein